MRCVAAAIFNEFGEPVGGVSVSGPTVRVTPEQACRASGRWCVTRQPKYPDDRRATTP